MSPLENEHVLLSSVVATVFVGVVGSIIFIILCCKCKRKSDPLIETEVGETTPINCDVQPLVEDSSTNYGSTSTSSKHQSSSPQDIEQNLEGEGVPPSIDEHDFETSQHRSIVSSYQASVNLGSVAQSQNSRSGSSQSTASEIESNSNTDRPQEHSDEEVPTDVMVEQNSDTDRLQEHSDVEVPTDEMVEQNSNQIRLREGIREKEIASDFSQRSFSKYSFKAVADLGSRLQKYWFIRMELNECSNAIMMQMTAKVSPMCPLHLSYKEIPVLKEFLACLQHPFLLPVHDVSCDGTFISLLTEYIESGSLRDRIYSASPLNDWDAKYTNDGVRNLLPVEEIATCGRHVLEAVLLLYQQGFQNIAQIQSGNIFKKNDRYILGGYENTLLGYRSSSFAKIQSAGQMRNIDVIMFSLLVFEMATGISNIDTVPLKDSDLEQVNDDKVKQVLLYIFSDQVMSAKTKEEAIEKILKHSFFSLEEGTQMKNPSPFELSVQGHHLLSAVKAKESGQSSERFTVKCIDVISVLRKLPETYTEISSCDQIGWRTDKAMAKAKHKEFGWGLFSIIEVTSTCPVYVEPGLPSIREVLKLPDLLTTHDVHYLKVGQEHYVILFQKFVEGGSLKDKLHKTSPLRPWHEKYRNEGIKLPDDEIAKIGSQLLNITASLCHIDGEQEPLKLRFLHSGNVFVDGDRYLISGVENMLLGCRPRDYVKFRTHLSNIDTIMFAHLIFELATGRELSTAIPTSEDYSLLSGPVEHLLNIIFSNLEMNLKEISSLDFFNSYQSQHHMPKSIKNNVKLLLNKVRSEKKRSQDDESRKRTYSMKVKIGRTH